MEKNGYEVKTVNALITQLIEGKQLVSLRDAFGLALSALGDIDKRIVVLDADLAESTKTSIFAQKHPDRFYNIGISEQDMISIGAGMATCGKVPFIVTFAVFLIGRGLDQIRNMIAYCNLNVKLVGTHVGLSTGPDGATHQALEDIGIMRGIPGIEVLSPADAIETIKMVQYTANIKNPVYLRIPREKDCVIHNLDYSFKPKHVETIEDYEDKRIALVSTGTMVSRSIEAAKILKTKNIDVGVINVHTLKPIDQKSINQIANNVELLVTVEDHNILGGLGTIVADVMAEANTKAILRKIGVKDTFGESGSQEELYEKYGLTPHQIAKQVINEMEKL